MKFQIQRKVKVQPDRLYSLLCDTAGRRNWLPVFECKDPVPLRIDLELHSEYTFLKREACTERYFRVIQDKEIALRITCSKGVWTVFIVLMEIPGGTEVTLMAELESNAWVSSIMLWIESGKLELFGHEYFDRFVQYAESQELQPA